MTGAVATSAIATPVFDVLETPRLVLRPPVAADWPGVRAFYLSQRSRFTYGPKTEAAAWRSFAAEIGHWTLRGYGMFTLSEKGGDDTGLGLVGPFYPLDWPEPEIGWMLWPAAEGRGYGYEAARACLAHAFGALGWTTAVSYIDAANDRSIALAERLGARLDAGAATLSADTLVYRHPRPEPLP